MSFPRRLSPLISDCACVRRVRIKAEPLRGRFAGLDTDPPHEARAWIRGMPRCGQLAANQWLLRSTTRLPLSGAAWGRRSRPKGLALNGVGERQIIADRGSPARQAEGQRP